MSEWTKKEYFEMYQDHDAYVWIAYKGQVRMAYYRKIDNDYLFRRGSIESYSRNCVTQVAVIKRPMHP